MKKDAHGGQADAVEQLAKGQEDTQAPQQAEVCGYTDGEGEMPRYEAQLAKPCTVNRQSAMVVLTFFSPTLTSVPDSKT